MQDVGLHWNPKKCNVIHVRRGKQAEDAADLKLDEATLVENLKTGFDYKFLGMRNQLFKMRSWHFQLRQRRTCKGSQ